MEQKKTDLWVIVAPVRVEADCPYCDHHIRQNYSEFEKLMPESSCWQDWLWTDFKCENCGGTIEISDVRCES